MNKKTIQRIEYIKSNDICLISVLHSLGYQIEKIEKDGQKAIFIIVKDERTDEIIKKFWAHQLKTDPLGFYSSLKEIKTRIYAS